MLIDDLQILKMASSKIKLVVQFEPLQESEIQLANQKHIHLRYFYDLVAMVHLLSPLFINNY